MLTAAGKTSHSTVAEQQKLSKTEISAGNDGDEQRTQVTAALEQVLIHSESRLNKNQEKKSYLTFQNETKWLYSIAMYKDYHFV